MKVKYLSTIAIVSVLGLGLVVGCANPCASKGNPCASKENPCASKGNPCASKENPCASKENPCASKTVNNTNQSSAKPVFTENGIAIKGTDPVAYFQEQKPVAGSSEFSHQWNNATWHFSSAENRDLFVENPQAYAPQYGGHCAWALAQGDLVEIDPNAWKIVDGKLYLNFDRRVQQKWERDIPGFITKANQHWSTV